MNPESISQRARSEGGGDLWLRYGAMAHMRVQGSRADLNFDLWTQMMSRQARAFQKLRACREMDSGLTDHRFHSKVDMLQASQLDIEWGEIVKSRPTGTSFSALPGVIEFSRRLASATADAVRQHRRLLVIGGDHSCAIGTWSGVASALRDDGPLGLLWVDAHLDSHTPDTSESGNINGMPIAHLLGTYL